MRQLLGCFQIILKSWLARSLNLTLIIRGTSGQVLLPGLLKTFTFRAWITKYHPWWYSPNTHGSSASLYFLQGILNLRWIISEWSGMNSFPPSPWSTIFQALSLNSYMKQSWSSPGYYLCSAFFRLLFQEQDSLRSVDFLYRNASRVPL